MSHGIVRYGLISTAKIGLNAHLPASRTSKNSEIVSISSRTASKAEAAAKEHGLARWYGSYEEQLADSYIDAVINSLPNSMHCEWTIKAAEAGKHILCEKPLAVSIKECQRMIDAADSNNVLLVEAFTHRWNPHLRKARELIANGVLGNIATIDAALCFNAEPENNIRYSGELAGGALWDAGCYAVYAARFVLSEEPVRVRGIGHDSGGWDVDTTFSGIIEFPSGAIANVTGSMDQPFRCQISIDGSKGRIEIPAMFDDSGPIIVKTSDNENKQEITTPAPNRFTAQLDEFSQCILTGKPPEFSAKDGLHNTAVIEALYTSAYSGQAVNIKL
ncbi:MAG: NAD-binding protein [Acidiferrobacteraceae bacterium]|nr:NAD-binding protein [Acidiferrobacteraceae bacterium]|tara:strand:- start:216 stop:1211 length:996 start_codon:yes stop_codon:yes gene_type:complete